MALRKDTSGITGFTYEDSDTGDTDVEKVKVKRDVKPLGKRGLGSWSGGCAESVQLPLGAIPIDVPALLHQSYAGFGTYNVELEPITVSASATKKKRKTITVPEQVESTSYDRATTRTCDGSRFPQPCLNYRSIASRVADYADPTCANVQVSRSLRPLPALWNRQHNTNEWISWNPKSYTDPSGKKTVVRPQRDEWPPAHFQQGAPLGYVRLLPGSQNGKVANDKMSGWKGFCKYPPQKQVKVEGGPIVVIGDVVYETVYTSTITTLKVMSYEYTSMPNYPGDKDGLTTNPGWPKTLTDDPGFALLANDPYYPQPALWPYRTGPPASLTQGKTKPKRDRIWFDEEFLAGVVDEGNSSRRATPEEMLDELNILQCEGDCSNERNALSDMGVLASTDDEISSPAVTTATTTTAALGSEQTKTPLARPANSVLSSLESSNTAMASPTTTSELHHSRVRQRRHGHGHRHGHVYH